MAYYLNLLVDEDGTPVAAVYRPEKYIKAIYDPDSGKMAFLRAEDESQERKKLFAMSLSELRESDSSFGEVARAHPNLQKLDVVNRRPSDWRAVARVIVDDESMGRLFASLSAKLQDEFIASEYNDKSFRDLAFQQFRVSKNERKKNHILLADPDQSRAALGDIVYMTLSERGIHCEYSDAAASAFKKTLKLREKLIASFSTDSFPNVTVRRSHPKLYRDRCYVDINLILDHMASHLPTKYLLSIFTNKDDTATALPGPSSLDLDIRPILPYILEMLEIPELNSPQSVRDALKLVYLGNDGNTIDVTNPELLETVDFLFRTSPEFLSVYDSVHTSLQDEAKNKSHSLFDDVVANSEAALSPPIAPFFPNTQAYIRFGINSVDVRHSTNLEDTVHTPMGLELNVFKGWGTQDREGPYALEAGQDYIDMMKTFMKSYYTWLFAERVKIISQRIGDFEQAFAEWQAKRNIRVIGDVTPILNPYSLAEASSQETTDLEAPLREVEIETDPTYSTFDLNVPEDDYLLSTMWEDSEANKEALSLSDLSDEDLTAALQKLKEIANAEDLKSRKYTRGGVFRLQLSEVPGAYIQIDKKSLNAEVVNRDLPIPDEINDDLTSILFDYEEWVKSQQEKQKDRDAQRYINTFKRWLNDNGIVLVNGTPESFLEVEEVEEDLGEETSILKAEIDTKRLNLESIYDDAIASGDTETAEEADGLLSALATETRKLYAAEEVGGPRLSAVLAGLTELLEDPPSSEVDVEVDVLPPIDSEEISDLGTDERLSVEIDRILDGLDISEYTENTRQVLYSELDKRGLSAYKDSIRILENGDVSVGAWDGALEGILLPSGLSYDQRREFVKAIKVFESAKNSANRKLLADISAQLGLEGTQEDLNALLAYGQIPQFSVRKDYLNTYVERSLPGEEVQMARLTTDKLRDFETEPTVEKFNDLQGYIESLLRYDPSNIQYHHMLDQLIKITDQAKIFGKTSVKYTHLPLIQRTQSKAASVYGERGYVPVVEDPLLGIERESEEIARNILNLAESDTVEFYENYDPDMLFDFFEDRGISLEDAYLPHKGLEDLPVCVHNALVDQGLITDPGEPLSGDPDLPDPTTPEYGYSFEMTFGNYDTPKIIRCHDLEIMVLPSQNKDLESTARSIFDNLKSIYDILGLSADVEIDVMYEDRTEVNYRTGYINEIAIDFRIGFSQGDINQVYTDLARALAEIVTSQDPDLDPDDKDLDGDDLLAMVKIPDIKAARSNPSSKRNMFKILEDLEAISQKNIDYEVDLDTLTSIYTHCMGEDLALSLTDWDMSQFIGETASEAAERREYLALLSGLDRYMPYDISTALDDADFEDMTRELQYALKKSLSNFDNIAQREEFVRRRLAEMYKKLVPKYFGNKTRIVHISTQEAEDFVRDHHSLMGESDLNKKGLLLTIGAESDGKLVAVAVANSPVGRTEGQMREVDLSRVASDGSKKKVSSLLAGTVLQLTLNNLLSRDLSKDPLFVTYSTLDEQGDTYMALLGMGLRPVYVTNPPKDRDDVRGIQKIRWEAGNDAAPADLNIARFLQISYAKRIEKDSQIEKVGTLWGIPYIAKCMLSMIDPPRNCKSTIQSLVNQINSTVKKGPRSTYSVRSLQEYAPELIEKLTELERASPELDYGRRRKNLAKFLVPFEVCQMMRKGKLQLESDFNHLKSAEKYIKSMLQNKIKGKCIESDIRKALTEFLNQFKA